MLINPHSLTKISIPTDTQTNEHAYLRIKYIGRKSEKIGDPTKISIFIPEFDATKYEAADLMEYVDFRMEDKLTEGSAFTPGSDNTGMYGIMLSFKYSTQHFEDPNKKTQDHIPIQLNSMSAPIDFTNVMSRPGSMQFTHTLLSFGDGIFKYRSEPTPEALEECKRTYAIRLNFGYLDRPGGSWINGTTNDISFVDLSTGITNGVIPTKTFCVQSGLYCMLADIEATGAVTWTIVARKDPF